MCTGMRWRWILWMSAEFTSGRRVGRFMRRRMRGTTGRRLCGICRRCCRSRCRRWHDKSRVQESGNREQRRRMGEIHPGAVMIRVVLPQHLRTLAGVGGEVTLAVDVPVTVRRVLDALEERYPMLRGTIREYET